MFLSNIDVSVCTSLSLPLSLFFSQSMSLGEDLKKEEEEIQHRLTQIMARDRKGSCWSKHLKILNRVMRTGREVRLFAREGRGPTFWRNSGLGGDMPSSTKNSQEPEHSPPSPHMWVLAGREDE